MSLVGHQPSSLHWTIQLSAGTQLFIALLDSSGTSLGVLPDMYIVIPDAKDCLTKSESLGAVEAAEPEITPRVLGCLTPCPPWGASSSGTELPYSVGVVAPKSGNVFGHSGSSGEHNLPNMRVGRGQLGKATVISDANGILGMTGSVIDFAGTKDTPTAGILEVFSICRLAQPGEMPFPPREPPPTASRLRHRFPDHPHMELSRDLGTVDSSYQDTVAVAVCVSLGGMGLVMAIYAIMVYRRRQKVLDAQDTLPRPFEVIVPAATMTGASRTHDSTSAPMLNISSARVYPQKRRRGKHEVRREGTPAKTGPPRGSSAPIPTTTTPLQPQPSSSLDTRTQPHLSGTSLFSNRACPSCYHTPPRSWTHPHTPPLPSDPPTRSSSRAQPAQSSLYIPTNTPPRHMVGAHVTRSASVQERRSAKHALWLSRSASELHRTTSSISRYLVPEYGSHPSLGRYTHRHDGRELHVDTFPRSTSHLRQWHSASPLVDAYHVRSDPEEDVGGTIIFQHQDAGVMQELPPPYHKLIGSGGEV
ncbi:hypothetical protein HD554DRAFT_1686557 [Boletus coccyginus]|nr:hypothetical protein HD554DRAFT_1686557 [Boletus coccyginus]